MKKILSCVNLTLAVITLACTNYYSGIWHINVFNTCVFNDTISTVTLWGDWKRLSFIICTSSRKCILIKKKMNPDDIQQSVVQNLMSVHNGVVSLLSSTYIELSSE